MGVDEFVSKDVEDAKVRMQRKMLREKRALERIRRLDAESKIGPVWEAACDLLKKKELKENDKNNRLFLDLVRNLRSAYMNIHDFYDAFDSTMSSVSSILEAEYSGVVRADVQGDKVIPDCESCILKEADGSLIFRYNRKGGSTVKAYLDMMKENDSTTIYKVLSMVKRSTNKEDKQALKPMEKILKEKRKVSLEFEAIFKINSVSYLNELLKNLEDPPSENTLEVEARDVVKSRL
ncbi:hypothetical protein AgCh_017355 [Apium graveolens]